MATLTAQGVTDALQSVCGSPAAQGVEGAPQFRKELNLALPRLYNMGMWRDLLFEHVVSTSDGTFTIPDHAESVIAALLDPTGDTVDYSYPQEIRSQFHDYNIMGRNDRAGENTLAAFGIVDDGYSPTIEEVTAPSGFTGYQIAVHPIFPNVAVPTVAGTENLIINYSVLAGAKTATLSLGGESVVNVGDYDVQNVSQIKVGGVSLGEDVDVVVVPRGYGGSVGSAVNDSHPSLTLAGITDSAPLGSFTQSANVITVPVTDASDVSVGDIININGFPNSTGGVNANTEYRVTGVDKTNNKVFLYRSVSATDTWAADSDSKVFHYPVTKLAVVNAAGTVSRFRRYRVDVNNQKASLRLLLKRKFVTLVDENDVIHVSSLSAIKHAMLGNIAEENADLERANYHWSVCRNILDEQLDAHRGAAKPAIRFDPSGVGAYTSNMM